MVLETTLSEVEKSILEELNKILITTSAVNNDLKKCIKLLEEHRDQVKEPHYQSAVSKTLDSIKDLISRIQDDS
jgi:hypothetical protein